MHIWMSSKFSGGVNLWNVLSSVLFVTSLPWVRIHVESHSDVRFDYICIEPDTVSEGDRNAPVIMIHGVLDIKETWNGIYENVSALTNRKVCVYDARNHGGSSWNDTCTIDATVEDLESFMDLVKIDRAVLVGHSLGGQTAMKFALTYPSKVEALFVEDIGPSVLVGIEEGIGYLMRVLQRSLFKIPAGADEPTARRAILKYIRKFIGREVPLNSYRKYMPIYLKDGVWQWKTNLKAMSKALDDIGSVYTTMEGKYEGKTVFIYAKKSIFRVGDQTEVIRELFPNVKFVALDSGTHFIHSLYPHYLEELLDFLN